MLCFSKKGEKTRFLRDRVQRNAAESQLGADLHAIEQLNSLTEEIDGIESKVGEKQESLHALMGNVGLSDKQRDTLIKLCDLHAEFLSLSAVIGRVKDLTKRPEPEPRRDPLRMDDPLRVGPPRRPGFNPGPNPMDPFGREPEPDHFRNPFDPDDDRSMVPFPDMPGQQPGMPGQYPGMGPLPGGPRPPPGYNPDYDRDRDPMGPFAPGPPGGRQGPPPGPFNPGGGFGGPGGGFGGPRFL